MGLGSWQVFQAGEGCEGQAIPMTVSQGHSLSEDDGGSSVLLCPPLHRAIFLMGVVGGGNQDGSKLDLTAGQASRSKFSGGCRWAVLL